MKPTILIIPGAWQLPTVWDGFRGLLTKAQYPSVHVALPSVGGTTLPLTGLAEDVAAVRSHLSPIVEDGKDVVVVCHSSGGVVCSNAVEGFDKKTQRVEGKKGKKGGVVRIVYVSAFMLPQGQSLLGMLGGQPLPWMVVEGDRVTGDPNMMPEVGFNDLPAADKQKWSKAVTHTSAALFATPSKYEPWKHGIPCSYIFCNLDNALPMPYQQGMAAQLTAKDTKTATLETGHCPFLSKPQELLLALESVLKTKEPPASCRMGSQALLH